MKNRIVVKFFPLEIASMRLRNGFFSVTRFKLVFRKKAEASLLSWIHGRGEADSDFSIERISVRDIDKDQPKNFRVEILCSSGGKIRWRQNFCYEFDDVRNGLGGVLIPGSRHYAK
jgi:hypothetical protein